MQSLSPPVQTFIERMGSLMEKLGAAKTLGRMFALLLVATRPLSLDEMAKLLLVSKASISTNARLCEQLGLVQRVGIPGDRKTYFEILPGAFGRMLAARMSVIDQLQSLAQQGLDALDDDNDIARARLEEMIAFYAFAGDRIAHMLNSWKERSESRKRVHKVNPQSESRKS